MRKALCVLLLALLVAWSCGCASMTARDKGLIIGGAAGAVVGGIIGKQAGNTAAGAIIGAAVGGATGAVIGNYMDKQAAEMQQDLEGAKIERIGEGIKITFDSGILFDVDKADLRPEAQTNLEKLAVILNKYEDTNILIEGHTDSDGIGGVQPRALGAAGPRGAVVPRPERRHERPHHDDGLRRVAADRGQRHGRGQAGEPPRRGRHHGEREAQEGRGGSRRSRTERQGKGPWGWAVRCRGPGPSSAMAALVGAAICSSTHAGRRGYSAIRVTFSADGPLSASTMSNSTLSPSARLRKPSDLMAE